MVVTRRIAALFFAVALTVASLAIAQLEHAPALAGLDPVELVAGKEVEGSERISETYEGYRYVFASKRNHKKFRKDPEQYRIQNQTCLVEPGAPARSELFSVYKKRIYIFATEQCVRTFEADPEAYVKDQGQGKT